MIRMVKWGVIAVLIGVVGSACGSGDGSSAETRSACGIIGLPNKVINGQSCGDLANSTVVRILSVRQGASGVEVTPICTGTLVTADVVLTAAHCLDRAAFVAGYVAYGIYVGEPGAGRSVIVKAISQAPGYRYDGSVSRSFDDAALLLLSEPVSISVSPILLSRTVRVGELGFVYGYGQRDPQRPSDFFTLEAGAMTVGNVTPNHIFVVFEDGAVTVCYGDSGGPLIVLVDGQPAVAGVVSEGAGQGCIPGDVVTFTNLQSPNVLSWLAQMIPNAQIRSSSLGIEEKTLAGGWKTSLETGMASELRGHLEAF